MRVPVEAQIRAWMITLLLLPGIGAAVEDDSLASTSDPLVEKAAAAIARKGWSDARAILREALNANPANAEYHNLYAVPTSTSARPI